ncbi:MAG TPA: hypothetical protein VJ843_01080 [Candidatus Saccharimonadales bacterium]|nr:hypothetical protein [Candidatus Saccharimonadales bacterium]
MPTEQPVQKRLPRGIHRVKAKHVLTGVCALIVFLLLVGLSSTPKIVVTGSGSSRLALQNTSVYETAVHQMLGKSMANNNKLTINTDAVATELKAKYPELHTVTVSLPFFGRQPIVYLQPVVPQMVLSTASGQFVIDSNGRALSAYTNQKLSEDGSQPIPIVTDQSGFAAQKGQVVLPSKTVDFITEVAAQMHASKINVETWTLLAGGGELDVKPAGASYIVKFSLQGIAREEAGTYLATKQYIDTNHITPKEYVDARVSGRAYYR